MISLILLQKKGMKHLKFKYTLLISMLLFLLVNFSCHSPKPSKISMKGETQGTYYTIHVYHTDTSEVFVAKLQIEIDSLLNAFNSVASIYDSTSLISRINNNLSYEMNDLFKDVFQKSMEISQLSGGAFDITVGPLVNAWGFGITDSAHISQSVIDSLIQCVGYEKVRLENGRIIKDNPLIKLDMNGIAQGYAVDLVADFIESKGIASYIVEIGGEVRVGKSKPDGSKWVIAIEKPAPDAESAQEEEDRIFLENVSVSTSGTYRRYYERSGERFSHTIDPKTGRPVKHSMLSATIIASDCMTADGLATACMVIGVDEALRLCESIDGVEGFFILGSVGDKYTIRYTNGFEKYLSGEN